MPALTNSERDRFTADQLIQLDRLSTDRRDEIFDGATVSARTLRVTTYVARTPQQLRARTNIIGIAWGQSIVVNYSPENDYTATERQTIADGLKGDKWLVRIPELLAAGLSVEQRLTAGGL
jgi:hypothetical protein